MKESLGEAIAALIHLKIEQSKADSPSVEHDKQIEKAIQAINEIFEESPSTDTLLPYVATPAPPGSEFD